MSVILFLSDCFGISFVSGMQSPKGRQLCGTQTTLNRQWICLSIFFFWRYIRHSHKRIHVQLFLLLLQCKFSLLEYYVRLFVITSLLINMSTHEWFGWLFWHEISYNCTKRQVKLQNMQRYCIQKWIRFILGYGRSVGWNSLSFEMLRGMHNAH